MDKVVKIFSIHFPEKRVYIENTSQTLLERMETIKNDRDHPINHMLEKYPNPEIRFECYKDDYCDKILVALKYIKFNILN